MSRLGWRPLWMAIGTSFFGGATMIVCDSKPAMIFQPSVPYPEWDKNWDHRAHRSGTKTRHILLVRHGQYVHAKKDEDCKLTELGIKQARNTGQRIAAMIQAEGNFKIKIKALHVSDMTRAKETAAVIAEYLPSTVEINSSDPLLNEGFPAQNIPGEISEKRSLSIFKSSSRAETAFRKYFHRDTEEKQPLEANVLPQDNNIPDGDTKVTEDQDDKHEFEIIVGHGNMIRYYVMRALQLPPEAWLRMSPFNCSITYLVIRPSGGVSLRSFADVGHHAPNEITFSMNEGYGW